jgi:hypothetical protein
MALRFQDKHDDVSEAVGTEQKFLIWFFAIGAAYMAIKSWLSGESTHSYEKTLVIAFVCFWLTWLTVPLFYEIRIRTRELYGMVSEINKTVSAFSECHEAVLEKLCSLEDDLRSLKYEQHPSRPPYRLPLPD